MSATNLFINWSAAGFTPSGGSLQSINKVTDVSFDANGSMEGFKGDVDVFFRSISIPSQTRTIKVKTGDVAMARDSDLALGTRGAFTVKLSDAVNGTTTGGGGLTVTLSPCIVTANTAQGAHAKYAEAEITFEGYATDGTTDPLTVAAL